MRCDELVVSVHGLGYVGLAVAAVWLRAGARVIGVDVDSSRIRLLSEGRIKYPEREVVEALRSPRFEATSDGVGAARRSNVHVITVPVKLSEGRPDFGPLVAAARDVAMGLKRGDAVIVESSVPPGTTRRVVLPILEESGLEPDKDFYLAYSPERIMVGRAVKDIEENYPKVVSGIGSASAEFASSLYGCVARRGVLRLSTVEAAEFEKLAEGVYRDVNIALVNELVRLANALGVNFNEVIDAANSQPYSHLHRPGPGVGGNCIPVYPHFLLHAASGLGITMDLLSLARRINDSQPRFIARSIIAALIRHGINPASSRVALLGLAFRGGIDDTRLSPTYGVVDGLLEYGLTGRNIVVHDPYVARDGFLESRNVRLTSVLEDALDSDAIVVLTDHPEYRMHASHLRRRNGSAIVMDTRGVVADDWDARTYVLSGGRWPISG